VPSYIPNCACASVDAEHAQKFLADQSQLQKDSPHITTSSRSSFDSHMLQGSNAFKWLSISSKCGLEAYAQACIELIVAHQLPLPSKGITACLQPQHADALMKGVQQAQVQAQMLL
jgi:hypothetical protein